MEVYLSIDNIGRFQKPQDKFEIIETRNRTAGKWQKTDIGEAARLIGAMGHTVIPGHLEGGTKACNCTAMQVFMLDFDDGIRYTEIEGRCKELGIPISFAYHTFSSTEKKEKFRIAFAHESLIADPYIIKIALCMLMQIFPESDRACSNLDRMFYGGKELICLNENAHFALVQLTLPFYRSLDINKNFSRNVESFARKHQMLLYNGRLAMGDASFYQDFIKDMKNDGNRVSAIIHILGESPFPSFCMVEGSVYKRHQSIRCRQEIKNLQVKEGMGCRLLDDFLSGADMSHNQRLALLTNLMQVKGGRKLFFEAMERYYKLDSVEKWRQYPYYMKGYKPQRCSGQFCPYYVQCANAGTIVDTLMRDRKVYRKDTVYHTLEEAEDCMRGNLYDAYHACSLGIHLIRAQTGIGKTTAYIELVRKEKGAKFIIAVPTIMLKEEVYRRLIKAGIPAEEIFLTRNIRGNPLIPGEMRADVNLSVREAGAAQFGTRTEMKNLNSFKAISRAIAGETERQIDLIESGGKVVQETRRWDDIKGESYAMRSKEDAQDYRYFPDPDLTPVAVSDEMLEQIRARQPEFRNEKRKRYREEFEIPAYDIEIITGSKHMADLFEAATAICGQPKKVSNWLMGETMRLMKETETDAQDLRFSPENLAKLIGLVDARVINGSVAKEVFEVMFEENMDPEQYVEEKGLKTVNDEGALRRTIEEVIAANPQSVEDYKNGKEKAIGFLVGQTMKAMKGKADPAAVNQIIREACGK